MAGSLQGTNEFVRRACTPASARVGSCACPTTREQARESSLYSTRPLPSTTSPSPSTTSPSLCPPPTSMDAFSKGSPTSSLPSIWTSDCTAQGNGAGPARSAQHNGREQTRQKCHKLCTTWAARLQVSSTTTFHTRAKRLCFPVSASGLPHLTSGHDQVRIPPLAWPHHLLQQQVVRGQGAGLVKAAHLNLQARVAKSREAVNVSKGGGDGQRSEVRVPVL